ncbi:TIR domain-containing protein [Nostoc sp.]|uniref:TIR domain-containing protein n=1 Tax=Nostoc sp. TaxID=1180 RepID=UPI002FFC783B
MMTFLQNFRVAIVCLSHRSINKIGFVQREVKFTLDVAEEQPEGSIFIIPAKLEECDIPQRLHQWQWVNLYEQDGYKRLLLALRVRAKAFTITE